VAYFPGESREEDEEDEHAEGGEEDTQSDFGEGGADFRGGGAVVLQDTHSHGEGGEGGKTEEAKEVPQLSC